MGPVTTGNVALMAYVTMPYLHIGSTLDIIICIGLTEPLLVRALLALTILLPLTTWVELGKIYDLCVVIHVWI